MFTLLQKVLTGLGRLRAMLLPDSRRRRRFWLYLRRAAAVWLDREPSTIWLQCDYPLLYDDAPLSITGPVLFKGWALATRGVARVTVSSEGHFVGRAFYGIARPDVAVMCANLRQSLCCGFQFHLDPRALSAGLQKLTFTAHSHDGKALGHSFFVDVNGSYRDWEPITCSRAPHPVIETELVRRILIVKLDHLGDTLLSFPAIERLRELFPKAEITALVGSWAHSLVEDHPCIDRVLTYNFFDSSSSKGHKELNDDEGQQLRDWLTPMAFDLAVDFRREPETRDFLLWSGARYSAGFANEREAEWLTVALPFAINVKHQRPRCHIRRSCCCSWR
jgi:hypothetical protein